MIKFTVDVDEKTFTCDYSKFDPENPDYCPTVEGALYDMYYLLSCVFDKRDVAEAIFKGNDFQEFVDNGFERLKTQEKAYRERTLGIDEE